MWFEFGIVCVMFVLVCVTAFIAFLVFQVTQVEHNFDTRLATLARIQARLEDVMLESIRTQNDRIDQLYRLLELHIHTMNELAKNNQKRRGTV